MDAKDKHRKIRRMMSFRLEERVLFEAAAAVDIVEAVENADQVVQQEEKKQQENNISPNVSGAELAVDFGAPIEEVSTEDAVCPEEIASIDAMLDSLVEGEIVGANVDTSYMMEDADIWNMLGEDGNIQEDAWDNMTESMQDVLDSDHSVDDVDDFGYEDNNVDDADDFRYEDNNIDDVDDFDDFENKDNNVDDVDDFGYDSDDDVENENNNVFHESDHEHEEWDQDNEEENSIVLDGVGNEFSSLLGIDEVENIDNEFVEVSFSECDVVVSTNRELVILNSTLPDKDAILTKLTTNQDVLILDSASDAMEEIQAYLESEGQEYSAIHIVSHGNDGYFTLNGKQFTIDSLVESEWASIGKYITQDGDILLYGCNLAQSADGQALVQMIADFSGADVAASIDATGISGNWDLEYTVGKVITESLSIDTWNYDLAPLTLTVNETGDLESANGIYTLRETLARAATMAGSYDEVIIQFDATTFATEASRIITINRELIIDDALSNKPLTINGAVGDDGRITVKVPVTGLSYDENTGEYVENDNATDSRVFRAGHTSDSSHHWKLTFQNLVIQGGNVQTGVGTDSYSSRGGAIFVQGYTVDLTLANTEVSCSKASPIDPVNGNALYSYGGGLYLYSSNTSKLTLNNATIVGNMALAYAYRESIGVSGNTSYGGGIYVRAGSTSTISLENSSVNQNISKAYTYHEDIANTSMDPSTHAYGGGIYNQSNVIQFSMVNSTLARNEVHAYINTIQCSYSSNPHYWGWSRAYSYGGGFYNSTSNYSNTYYVIHSTITGNISTAIGIHVNNSYSQAASGTASYGGVYILGGNSIFENSIVYGNYTEFKSHTTQLTYNFSANDIQANYTYLAYSIYGQVSNISRNIASTQYTTDQNNLSSIFETVSAKETLAGNTLYVPVLNEDTTVHLLEDAPVTKNGTKIGYTTNGNYYFWNKNTQQWWDLLNNTSYTGALTVIEEDQLGFTRMSYDATEEYDIGAKATAIPDVPSLVVSNIIDFIHPFDGKISLREALNYAHELAENTPGIYTITFDDTLFENGNTITIQMRDIYEAFELGAVLAGSSLIVDGGEGRNVIVKVPITYAESLELGLDASTYRVFQTTDNTISWNLSFKNLTIQGGEVNGSGGTVFIQGVNSNVSLENVTVSDSHATGQGGGIYIASQNEGNVQTTLTIVNSIIENNTSVGNGGGLYISTKNTIAAGTTTTQTILTITDSVFQNNTSQGKGGGLYVETVGRTANNNVFIDKSSFISNTAYQGGGIYALTHSPSNRSSQIVTIENSTFTQNIATHSGGAIYSSNTTVNVNAFNTLHVMDSTITGNEATLYGGGIFMTSENIDTPGSNKLFLYNSIVYGNYVSNNSNDVYFNSGKNVLHGAYSLYSTIDHAPTTEYIWGTNVNNIQMALSQANLQSVFDTIEQNENGLWIASLSEDGRTIPIKKFSNVEFDGTLLGKIGNVYYFYNRNTGNWENSVDGTTYVFSASNPPYGLTNGTILSTAQNILMHGEYASRVGRLNAFNIGAYGLQEMSLVVTTLNDTLNAYDYQISLREALLYASQGAKAEDGSITITFDDALFGNNNTITITIASALTIAVQEDELTIDGGNNRNVLVKVINPGRTYNATTGIWTNASTGSAYRILETTNGNLNYHVTLKNMLFQGGRVNQAGGAIYIAGNNVTFTLENSSVYGTFNLQSGTIYIQGNTTSNIHILNSTISHNYANNHSGAIWINGSTSHVYIVNSTISGNIATTTTVGGALTFQAPSQVYFINSIVYGNYAGSAQGYDIGFASSNCTLTAINSTHGKYRGIDPTYTNINSTYLATNTQADLESVFTNVILSNGAYIPKSDGSPIEIENANETARNGALVGKIGNDYYYYDPNQNYWLSPTNTETFLFDRLNPITYGLTNGTVYTTAQNFNVQGERASRVASLRMFNRGAYTLTTFEAPSLIVTTEEDIVNAFDNLISLREAILYATDDIGIGNLIGADGKYTITFASHVNHIVVSRTLELEDTFHNQPLVIQGGENRNIVVTVTTPGRSFANDAWSDNANASDYRVFTVGNENSSTINWNLEFSNLTIKGGCVQGQGGAIYVQGNNISLSFLNTTISSSKATFTTTINTTESVAEQSSSNYGGGIYSYSYGNTMIVFDNSLVQGNKIENIFNYTTTYSTTTTSTSYSQSVYAKSHAYGGGLYSFSKGTSHISFVRGSSVQQNIAVAMSSMTFTLTVTHENTTKTTYSYAYAYPYSYTYGGGLYTASDGVNSLIFNASSVIDNTTDISTTGNAYNIGSNSNYSYAYKNGSGYAYGGGVYRQGAPINSENNKIEIIQGSYITGNTASTNATDNTNSYGYAYGGGIHNTGEYTNFSIQNSYIENNISYGKSSSYGGGMYHSGSYSVYNIENTEISYNIAKYSDSGYGGGIYHSGSSSTFYISNTKINNNELSGGYYTGYGAGMYVSSSSTYYFTNSYIENNIIQRIPTNYYMYYNSGAGLYLYNSNLYMTNTVVQNNAFLSNAYYARHGIGLYVSSGNVYITDSTISYNHGVNMSSSYQRGAGMYYSGSGYVIQITNSTLSNNYNTYYGGGLCIDGSNNTISILDSTFDNNTNSSYGAAICINTSDYNYNNILYITNSTIHNNSALYAGGGLYFRGYNSAVHIKDSSFTSNKGGSYGGAMYFKGYYSTADSTGQNVWNITNTLIADNTATHGAGIYGEFSGNGIYNIVRSTLNIQDSSIVQNTASGNGGAIYWTTMTSGSEAYAYNVVHIVNSTIARNIANQGGGDLCSSTRNRIL
jgi:predicted outer membrane repeat protein